MEETVKSVSSKIGIFLQFHKSIDLNGKGICGWTLFVNTCSNGHKNVVNFLYLQFEFNYSGNISIDLNGKDICG